MTKQLNFALPDSLAGNSIQISAIAVNSALANYINEMAAPSLLQLSGPTIDTLLEQLSVQFEVAKDLAAKWSSDLSVGGSTLSEDVQGVLTDFSDFKAAMVSFYPAMVQTAYAAKQESDPQKQKAFGQTLIGQARDLNGAVAPLMAQNGSSGVLTRVKSYETALAGASRGFNDAASAIRAEIAKVSTDAQNLEAKLGSLRGAIENNNSRVTETFLNTAGSALEQGATIIGKASSKDVPGMLLGGITMGVGVVEGVRKLVVLDEQILADMSKVQSLLKEVTQDQLAVIQLLNLQSVFVTLGNQRGVRLDLVHEIINYYATVSAAAAQIADSAQPWELVDTLDYSGHAAPAPGIPPWSVTIPVQNAERCFSSYLDALATQASTWAYPNEKFVANATGAP